MVKFHILHESYPVAMRNTLFYPFLEGNTSRICEKTWLMIDLTNLGDINNFISFPIQGQHCLVGGIPTPLKNMSSSVGMLFFPTEWKN